MREFTEQELVRRDKLNKIKELGIDKCKNCRKNYVYPKNG